MEDATPSDSQDNTNRPFYLPRLPKEYYQGDAVVHWTLTIDQCKTGWLNDTFHQRFREIMLHAVARQDLMCPIYCLMPDHIHLIWMGLKLNSDQKKAMKFLREHLAPALDPFQFQHQAHDHVLREGERKRSVFENAVWYIMENPVRAELVAEGGRWDYCGAIIPGYSTFHPLGEDYWRMFWKRYLTTIASDAGEIMRPSIV